MRPSAASPPPPAALLLCLYLPACADTLSHDAPPPDAAPAVEDTPTPAVEDTPAPPVDAPAPPVDTPAPPVDAPAPPVDAPTAQDAAPSELAVRITAPDEGDTVSGVVRIAATAHASAGVARVEFFSAGGSYRLGEDRTAPFGIEWHTAGFVPDGAQRLRATVFDLTGRSASHELAVRVRNAPSTTLPADDLARVTAYFEARRGARYLEGECQPTTYTGWTGVPLRLCRYRVSDRYSGGYRTGEVIVANPEPAQLARWVVQAAMERRGRVLRADTDALCANIMGQSGAQFPVAGIVYEDMDGTGQRIYPFRNGVTVRVEGLPYATREQPTSAQMALYRTGALAYIGRFGRIAGTLPEHWTALTGERVAADRSNWPEIVGRAHREAWGNDRNALMVAWARANL
jgi:hypothetical protein